MNNAFDPDEFNIDDLDPDIGETIIEGSWLYDNTGAPVSWGGSNRIADLGDGRWRCPETGSEFHESGDALIENEETRQE